MTQTIPLAADARERFLLEIAAVLAPERIVEAHFFAPMRQGQIETGVCVLGALPEGAEPQWEAATEPAALSDSGVSPQALDDDVEAPVMAAEGDHGRSETAEHGEGSVVAEGGEGEQATPFPEGARISARHVVYSARYRWTRKGPERGKWLCEVVAEADAPLLTVEAVVQGVKQRASEPLEVEKVDGDAVRAMIAQARQQWPTTA